MLILIEFFWNGAFSWKLEWGSCWIKQSEEFFQFWNTNINIFHRWINIIFPNKLTIFPDSLDTLSISLKVRPITVNLSALKITYVFAATFEHKTSITMFHEVIHLPVVDIALRVLYLCPPYKLFILPYARDPLTIGAF